MYLPQDKNILFSMLNTYLRDKYKSLDEFCLDNDINKKSLIEDMLSFGFIYDKNLNQFIGK